MFRRSHFHKFLCSEGLLFGRFYVTSFYVQKVLCSEIFVQKVLCLESTGDYLSIPIGHTTFLRRWWQERLVTVPSGFPSLNEV